MKNSIKTLKDCIKLGKANDFDDQHSLGCKDMQIILIKMIEEGKFDEQDKKG